MQYGTDNTAVEAESYGGGTGGSSGVNLRHYWYVLLERRWLVICAYLAVLIASGAYLYTAPRIFRATTRLQIDPEAESAVNLGSSVVVTATGIPPDPVQEPGQPQPPPGGGAEGAPFGDPRYSKNLDVISALADDLTVSPVRMTRLVDVKIEHTSPQKAASIANTLADEFIDWMAAVRNERASSMLFFLRNQVSGLEGEVTKAEKICTITGCAPSMSRWKRETASSPKRSASHKGVTWRLALAPRWW
jgi:uncharacterized protein involved in exopolysaccharide biosynthesis